MKRPASVKVLGQPFTITWLDTDDPLSNRAHLGRTQIAKLLITVDAQIADDQLRDTLLHELLHAALRMVGGAGQSDAAEERVVGTLTPILLDILRANPDVAKYLLE